MKRHNLDIDDLLNRYRAGESENGLAHSLGVSRNVIRRRLIEADEPVRGQSEAEAVKWGRMTAAQRTRQVAAAHAATRGRSVPDAERVKIAATVATNENQTVNERLLGGWLTDRGIEVVPQQQIHVYNCDLGAFPVAVEIFGGNWHWAGRHQTRLTERFRCLFDAGWHILVVHVTGHWPLTESAADHIVSYVEFTRRNPALRREYRMIRGDSEPMLVCTEDDEVPVVYPFASRRNAATGRYESVTR